ncbi:MAG: hypothetical protein AAFX99_11735 [Myxococcota bacterium]
MHTIVHSIMNTVMMWTGVLGVLMVAWSPTVAQAQAEQQGSTTVAVGDVERNRGALKLFHVPLATLTISEEAIRLRAMVTRDWEATAIWVAVRPIGQKTYERIPLQRAADLQFQALLPAALLQPPGVEYYIGSTDRSGAEQLHFATPEQPHPVLVRGETREMRRDARLERHDGRRSQFRLIGDGTVYGRRVVGASELPEGATGPTGVTDANSDWFWRTELAYTYRPLRTLYDFHFGVGVMRGNRATLTLDDGVSAPVGVTRSIDEPGLNYGYGGLTLELGRNFSTEARVILGASEQGFVAGVGGLLRIGTIGGTRLELGGEAIQDAGALGFLRFAWDTIDRVPMALAVELSSWPDVSVNPRSTRLLYDVGFEVTQGLTLDARVGYATRLEALDPGWVVGTGATWEF